MRCIFHTPVVEEEEITEEDVVKNMPSAAPQYWQYNDKAQNDAARGEEHEGRFIRRTLSDVNILTDALQKQWNYQTLKFVVYLHEISAKSHRRWACPIKLWDLKNYIVSRSIRYYHNIIAADLNAM